MTFDDDLIRILMPDGRRLNVPCKRLSLDWPPPERIWVEGREFVRKRLSALTDEEREGMQHVFRGAEYAVKEDA